MKFKPSDVGNGILMYCAQSKDGLGDFIAIVIKDRHVEFRFDSGSGMAVVRSNHVVQPGIWLNLQASREAREGKLSINDEPQVSGKSPGPVRPMTLNTLMYIGGVDRHRVTVNRNVGVEKNFRGCISELDISGQSIDILRSAVESSNIKDCVVKSNQTDSLYEVTHLPTRPPTSPPTTQVDPCSVRPCVHGTCHTTYDLDYSCQCDYGYNGRNCENVLKQCELQNPCVNGGICTDVHRGYKCDCQLRFSGPRCETSVEILNDVAFRGDGWLELERTVMIHEEETEVIGFEISTNKSSGVIMWHGQTPTDLIPDDYISLAVVDGYVEFQYNLGSGPAAIRVTAQRVDDGERHRIVLKRQGSYGSIELNGEHTEKGESGGLQQLLNARGSVYLGGVPDYKMTFGRYEDGFSGCIYTMEVQDSGAIVIGDKAIRGRNVFPCTRDEIDDRLPVRGDGGHVQR